MVTQEEFNKAYQAARSNDKDINSKYIVACYYLEQKQLPNARSYFSGIVDHLTQAQELGLFNALQTEIARRHNSPNGYYEKSDIRAEDLCSLILLLQKLHANSVQGADVWLLKTGASHATLLKWIDGKHEVYSKLGDMFYRGSFGLSKDLDYAATLLKKAYELNRDANTANLIGCVYYEQKKYDDALEYFKKASDGRNQYGSCNAGLIYQDGLGKTGKNLSEAERLYKKAIQQVSYDQVYSNAHYRLAMVYQALHEHEKSQSNRSYGRSNLELCKENYKIAADSKEGHALSAFELAKLYQAEKNDKDAEVYFKKAEGKGHAESQIKLWEFYKALNRPEASAYLNQCAAAGNAQAMYELGCQHESKGEYDQAFKCFYQADKKGYVPAKEKLTDKKTRLSGYFSLYSSLEKSGNTFEVVFEAMRPYLDLQKALAYYFFDSKFLLNALNRTIDAAAKEAPFQKLEFLGDAALSTSIREYFLDKNPTGWLVGDFDYATQALVANDTVLPAVAKQLKLANLIKLDETEQSHAVTDKMQADALEALIGAVFQDYGFSKAADSTSYYMKTRTVVHNLWKPWLDKALQEKPRSVIVQEQAVLVKAQKGKDSVLAIVSQPSISAKLQKESSSTAQSSVKPEKNSERPLSPATQRAFSAANGTVSAEKFSKIAKEMSNKNNRNVGKKGDTVLMTLLRNDLLRTDVEIPKIKTLVGYGALWAATNNKGQTAEQLLKEKHPQIAATFGK